MQYILQIYRKYIPEKTGSAEVQHSILAYLMVCELDGELKKTIFYKLFPALLHPASGVNLSTIGASIRCHLSQVEESPGFRFVLPNLVRSPCFLSFLAQLNLHLHYMQILFPLIHLYGYHFSSDVSIHL